MLCDAIVSLSGFQSGCCSWDPPVPLGMSLHVGDHVDLDKGLPCVGMHLSVCAQWGLCPHILSPSEHVHI